MGCRSPGGWWAARAVARSYWGERLGSMSLRRRAARCWRSPPRTPKSGCLPCSGGSEPCWSCSGSSASRPWSGGFSSRPLRHSIRWSSNSAAPCRCKPCRQQSRPANPFQKASRRAARRRLRQSFKRSMPAKVEKRRGAIMDTAEASR